MKLIVCIFPRALTGLGSIKGVSMTSDRKHKVKRAGLIYGIPSGVVIAGLAAFLNVRDGAADNKADIADNKKTIDANVLLITRLDKTQAVHDARTKEWRKGIDQQFEDVQRQLKGVDAKLNFIAQRVDK